MTDEKLQAHLRKVHGITEGTTYDPDIHFDVPAICFGPSIESNSMGGDGQHLRPEHDLGEVR